MVELLEVGQIYNPYAIILSIFMLALIISIEYHITPAAVVHLPVVACKAPVHALTVLRSIWLVLQDQVSEVIDGVLH